MDSKEDRWSAAMRAERKGDTVAYERLLQDVARVLRTTVRGRASHLGLPPSETEDVVQEILIGLHTMRRRWNDQRPFLPWLHAIVRYKLTDAVRRRLRERRTRVDLAFDDWIEVIDQYAPDESGLIDRDIDRALAALPAGQRRVVEALAVDGASIKETAARLNASEGTIRMTMHRALKKLSKLAAGPDPQSAGEC
ncbi:sigma-70 family RNA polymerase sigma factor [Chelatococcus sp. GCM10030263]|uniref:sigma-70 family RNA polymerase sigma factor n=1 Tax=Chelatococcus sp. GCM10030263 TaxID=3273387 RepID=UPI00361DE199